MVNHELVIPKDSVNDDVVEVTRLHHESGTYVDAGTPVLEYETSKAVTVVDAPRSGYVSYRCREGDQVAIGEVAAVIGDPGGNLVASGQAGQTPDRAESATAGSGLGRGAAAPTEPVVPVFSAAAAARVAAAGIDPGVFSGLDFVTCDDVARVTAAAAARQPDIDLTSGARRQPPTDAPDVIRQQLSPSQRAQIRALSEVAGTGMTSTVSIAVDCAGILRGLTRQHRMPSLLPVTLLEASRLLRKHPLLNAYFDDDHIALYRDVHVGVAIEIDQGLKVVKVAHCDRLGVGAIEARLVEASDGYAQGTLAVADLTGSTFTVSDLSGEAVLSLNPLVNRSQAAILGVAAPDRHSGEAVLSLAFDHRVLTGKAAATFLRELRDRLESYAVPAPDADSVGAARCSRCFVSLAADREAGGFGFAAILTHDGAPGHICRFCIVEA